MLRFSVFCHALLHVPSPQQTSFNKLHQFQQIFIFMPNSGWSPKGRNKNHFPLSSFPSGTTDVGDEDEPKLLSQTSVSVNFHFHAKFKFRVVICGLRVEILYLFRVDRNSCFKRLVLCIRYPNVFAGNKICARSARIMSPRLDSIAMSYIFNNSLLCTHH